MGILPHGALPLSNESKSGVLKWLVRLLQRPARRSHATERPRRPVQKGGLTGAGRGPWCSAGTGTGLSLAHLELSATSGPNRPSASSMRWHLNVSECSYECIYLSATVD